MTSRERVMTAMRREKPDRVPFDLSYGFAPAFYEKFKRMTGETDPDRYFGVDTKTVGMSGPREAADFSGYFDALPERAFFDEWGVGHLPTRSDDPQHAHLEGFLYPMLKLSSRRDALDYPLPDVEADYRSEHLPGQIRRLHEEGYAVLGGLACTIYEIAWYMRSMELLLMDFADNPEFAEALLDRITEKRVIQARRFAESGADILMLGDDVASQRGMLMSVPMWRRWLKPRMKRIIDAAKAVQPEMLVFYHSDGNATAIVSDLIEIGVDILNPVQPECMNPAELKRLYGDRLAFWGTVGTQTTLPFGTPEEVRGLVRERMETVGKGGGLFLAPTHLIEPEVPWENVTAFVEAVKEIGKYER